MPQPDDPRGEALAAAFRRQLTDAERRVWARLRDRRLGGYKFRRQFPCEGYVLDFFCRDARLAVELDGGGHYQRGGLARDDTRKAVLARLGIRVLRFTDRDALTNMDAMLTAVFEECRRRCPHPRPVRRRERTTQADGAPSPEGQGLPTVASAKAGEGLLKVQPADRAIPSPQGRGLG